MTDQPHVTCRDCRHWLNHDSHDLSEYPRDRLPGNGYIFGICHQLRFRLDITCTSRWDGCTVDSVETDANFYCAFAEAKQ